MSKKKAAKPTRKQARVPKIPRTVNLPGMENLKSARLERLAERVADRRASINQMRTDEVEDERAALAVMRQEERTSFRHAGVEFVRVPGEEKLRVRTSREAATAETDEPAGDE